jgi:lysophospholipase L1-like esterase
MLGTNDFQSVHQYTVWHSAQGIATLVSAIRRAPLEPGTPTPDILVVAPPPPRNPQGPMKAKFEGAEERSAGLGQAYRTVAAELGCHFFDASEVTTTSCVDGVHLDSDQHARLGCAIAKVVITALAGKPA